MFEQGKTKGNSPIANIEVSLAFSPTEIVCGNHRLLYIVGQLKPGGLERQLCYLLRGMDRECYKPAVVVWEFTKNDIYAKEIASLGIPIYSFSLKASRGGKLRGLRALLKHLNPEVVHSYSFFTNFAAQWAACGTRTISIGSVRSDFFWAKRESGFLLGHLSARWPGTQIYNSYSAAKHAEESKDIFVPKRIFVVRNGLDVKQFAHLSNPIPDKAIILGVGSLYPVKRWDRLLRATVEIKRKGVECKIQIVGDGPLRCLLHQHSEEMGISHCVEFLGYRQDISSLINSARFLVHTADTEGCPNVIMEAMACGRPVVAMDAGDIPRLVDDGKTGFVVRQGDEVSLVQRILELLQNHSLCVQMGTAARDKADREFGVDRLVTETLEAYGKAGWKNSTFSIGSR